MTPEAGWQEGAGSLLLLAAAHETGVLPALAAALPPEVTPASAMRRGRRPTMSVACRRMLVRTLLFLGAVGLHRTWDLRGYTPRLHVRVDWGGG